MASNNPSNFYIKLNGSWIDLKSAESKSGLVALNYANFIEPDHTSLDLCRYLEDWRTITASGYTYYDTTAKKEKPLKFAKKMSTPKNQSANLLYETGGPVTVRITPYGTSGLTFTTIYSDQTLVNNKTTKDAYDTNSVPSFIIFELQGGGGGGGGGGGTTVGASLDGQNGAGGSGGGFACGILKLDFDTYDAYEIQVGDGGAGGDGSDKYSVDVRDGDPGGRTSLYAIKNLGTTSQSNTLLAYATGGEGGICCNKEGWTADYHYHTEKLNSSTYDKQHKKHSCELGGSGYCNSSEYIFCFTEVSGGHGSKTNGVEYTEGSVRPGTENTATCCGGNVASFTAYFTELDTLKTTAGFYKSYSAQSGGSAGSSNQSGGGGASVLGTGGNGGGTAEDGHAGSGYGSGGGGGRYVALGGSTKGAAGRPGYCAIYY